MADEDVLHSFFSEISEIAPDDNETAANENKEILTVAAPGTITNIILI